MSTGINFSNKLELLDDRERERATKREKLFIVSLLNEFRGYLGPGGNHLDGKYANCSGGSTGYIDRLVLGRNHIYQYPGIVKVYGAPPLDPEGILGERLDKTS